MDLKELFEKIQKNTKGWVPPMIFDDVRSFIEKDGMEIELVDEVYKQTIYKETTNPLKYFVNSLRNLSVQGILTVADWKAHEEQFKAKKKSVVTNWKKPAQSKIPADQVPPLPPNVKRF